jgi:hypothetical protein
MKAFLTEGFHQDGHHVRIDNRNIAKEVAKYATRNGEIACALVEFTPY